MKLRRRTAPKLERPEFTGRLIGYARVSTPDQDVAMQVSALKRAGVHPDNIWSETVSGVAAKRPQRDLAMVDARKGDILVVYKLDRFGRSFRELLDIVHRLGERGIGFHSLTEGFDTTTPGGRFLFHMLGAGAEFERDLIRERTRDGMAEAKRRGVRLGAPLFMTPERIAEVRRRLKAGETVAQIADRWGISRQTIYQRVRVRPRKRRKT